MPRVNIESLFPGVFPVYINHVIARLPSKRHPWFLQRYQSSPTSRHTWVFFRTKKLPLTRFLPKKRRSPTVSYAKPKTKNTWKTSNPSEKILDVCLLCHVCFFPLERNIRDAHMFYRTWTFYLSWKPFVFKVPGNVLKYVFFRIWSLNLSQVARARLNILYFSRNISWFHEFHWLINELLNQWTT